MTLEFSPMNRLRVLVNVAMSADGKLDTIARKGCSISSSADKARVDQLRASVDGILVGGRTLLFEDPKLTVKSPALRAERTTKGLEENPAKVGVVSLANLDPGCSFLSAGPARRLIYTTSRTTQEQIARLENTGAEIYVFGENVVDLSSVVKSLSNQGFHTLLVEGGGTIIAEFFHLGLVDEVTAYIAPVIFGGKSAPTLADGPGFIIGQSPRLILEGLQKLDDEGGFVVRYTVLKGEDNGS
jgi:2,5-diamino-6-(ribosylamino)-4(3H)-pyrimidinone 5'-phosphate reductase